MRKLTIYRLFFKNSDCYRSGTRQTSTGVQVHSTGADNPYLKRYVQPNDGRLGVNTNGNSHNRPGVDVCASAYIGKLEDGTVAVYQALPWDMRCWISGKGKNGNANRSGFIGFEICEDDRTDLIYFNQAVMGTAVNLTAHLCQIMGVQPEMVLTDEFDEGDVLAVMDHSELAARGLASNHADITHWLCVFGKRMNDFRREVQAAMDEGVEVTYIDAEGKEEWLDMDKEMEVYASNGGYTNLRELPDTESAALEKLRNGDVVRVTAMMDVWSKVEHGDVIGYIMTQFLRDIPQDASELTIRTVITDEAGRMFEPVGAYTARTVLMVDGKEID